MHKSPPWQLRESQKAGYERRRRWRLTEDDNGSTCPSEDAPGTDVLLGQGVLYGREGGSDGACDEHGLDGGIDGIFRLIDFVVRRHDENMATGRADDGNYCATVD